MGKAYVMADEEMHPWIKEVLAKEPPEWWCDFKNLKKLESELNKYGREIFDTHIYFLPSEEPTMERPRFAVKWFEKEELEQFRNDKRFNTYSLSFSSTQPDVLAVVAYNQPVTRSTLEFIRGVNSDGALNNLIALGLVEEVGRLDAPGKPMLFGTSEEFLRVFNLSSLSELPDVDLEYNFGGLNDELANAEAPEQIDEQTEVSDFEIEKFDEE